MGSVFKYRRALFVALAFGLLLLRSKALFENPQFFLEDGTLFFVDSYNDGIFSIPHSYAGYLVVYQRLIAWICSFAPLAMMPMCYLLGGTFVSLVFLWQLTGGFFPYPWGYVASLVFVLCPFEGTDLITLTNSQWVLGAWLLLFIASRQMKGEMRAGTLGFFVIAAVTGPFIAILSPVVLLQYLRREINQRWAWAALAALALQLTCSGGLLAPRVAGEFVFVNTIWLQAAAMLFAYPFYLLLGLENYGIATVVVLVLSFVSLSYLFILTRRLGDRTSEYLLLAAVLFVLASLLAYRTDPSYLLFRPRYAILPTLAIAWALISLTARQPKLRLTLALIPTLICGLVYFVTPALENFHWSESSRCIGKEQRCELPLNWKGKTIEYLPDLPPGRAGRKGFLRDVS